MRKWDCRNVLEGLPERKMCLGKSGVISWASMLLSQIVSLRVDNSFRQKLERSWSDLLKNTIWDSVWPQPHFQPHLHSTILTSCHCAPAGVFHSGTLGNHLPHNLCLPHNHDSDTGQSPLHVLLVRSQQVLPTVKGRGSCKGKKIRGGVMGPF